MSKAKTRIRYRYRDRPTNNYFSLDTIKRIKDWFYVVLPIAATLWIVAGPYVDAKAAEYLKAQLVLIGADPGTISTLNNHLQELQETVKQTAKINEEITGEVNGLKTNLSKILEKLDSIQQQQIAPAEPAK